MTRSDSRSFLLSHCWFETRAESGRGKPVSTALYTQGHVDRSTRSKTWFSSGGTWEGVARVKFVKWRCGVHHSHCIESLTPFYRPDRAGLLRCTQTNMKTAWLLLESHWEYKIQASGNIFFPLFIFVQIKADATVDTNQHCYVLCFHGSLCAVCVGGPSRWAALIMKLFKPLRSDRHLLLIGNSSCGCLVSLKGKCRALR